MSSNSTTRRTKNDEMQLNPRNSTLATDSTQFVTISCHISMVLKYLASPWGNNTLSSLNMTSGRIVHPCRDCSKVFDTHYELVNHSRVHSNYRPYICTIQGCGKKFRWRSCLRYHQNNAVCIRKSRRGGYRRKKTINPPVSNGPLLVSVSPREPPPPPSPCAVEDTLTLPSPSKYLKSIAELSTFDTSPLPSLPPFNEFLLAPEHPHIMETNIPFTMFRNTSKAAEPLHTVPQNIHDCNPAVQQGNGTDGIVRLFVEVMYDPLA